MLEQLLAHLVGDYLLQSDWMAQQKTTRNLAAVCHALTYTLPFVLLGASVSALAVICLTHLVIDRFRLARFVCFAKNYLAPPSQWPAWERCKVTGYDSDRPPWLAVWLLIIADNTMHLLCNYAALRWLP